MKTIRLMVLFLQRMGLACVLVAGLILVSCSSALEPQPEPSKEDIRQDADRFFQKMEQEEGAQPSSPK